MNNVMTIVYNGSKFYRGNTLYQYDYGQRIKFIGFQLPDVYEVHFSNSQKTGFTVTVLGDQDGVLIPDSCLLTGKEIYVWLYLHETESDGETVYSIQIPVVTRPYISNTEPKPVQQDIITQAIAELRAAVIKSTEAQEASEQASQKALETLDEINEIIGQVTEEKEAAEAAAARAEQLLEDFMEELSEQGITFDEGRLEDIPEDDDGDLPFTDIEDSDTTDDDGGGA